MSAGGVDPGHGRLDRGGVAQTRIEEMHSGFVVEVFDLDRLATVVAFDQGQFDFLVVQDEFGAGVFALGHMG